MAYIDDILALSPEHIWEFDGNFNDSVGTSNGTNAGFSNNTAPLCEDVNTEISPWSLDTARDLVKKNMSRTT